MENAKRQITLRIPAKATVWYVGSGAIARGIGALTTPIFTRLLTPKEYGLYPLYNSWIWVLSILITLEVTGNAIYRGYQNHSDTKNEFTSAALGLIGALFVVFCSLYFAFYNFIGHFIGLSLRVSIFMLVQIFASSVIALYLAKAKFEYKYRAAAALNLASAFLIPISSIALIYLINNNAEARIYASSVTTVLLSVPIFITIIKGSDKLFNKTIWLYLIKHSIPLLPHYISTALILKIGEIAIGRYHGTDALGRYSVAMSIGMILTILTNGIMSALVPWITRRIQDHSIEKVRAFLYSLTKALSLFALSVLAFSPEVIMIFASESYRSSLPAVYPLEISVIAAFIAGAISGGAASFDNNKLSSVPSIISAFISIVLSVTVLPLADYRFAGIIALISYVILMLLSSLYFKIISGEHPIDLKKTLFTLLFTCAYAYVLFLFRDKFISRIFLSLPLVPLLLLSAKEIWISVKETG